MLRIVLAQANVGLRVPSPAAFGISFPAGDGSDGLFGGDSVLFFFQSARHKERKDNENLPGLEENLRRYQTNLHVHVVPLLVGKKFNRNEKKMVTT